MIEMFHGVHNSKKRKKNLLISLTFPSLFLNYYTIMTAGHFMIISQEIKLSTAQRKEEEREIRKKAIIQAAKEVLLEEGFDRMSMQLIADKARLAKGTLYLYFRNKEDLIIAILQESIVFFKNMILQVRSQNLKGIDSLKAIIQGFVEFRLESPEAPYFCLILDRIPMLMEFSRHEDLMPDFYFMTDLLTEILAEGIEDGSINRNIDPKQSAVLLIHLATSFLQRLANAGDFIEKTTQVKTRDLLMNLMILVTEGLKQGDPCE